MTGKSSDIAAPQRASGWCKEERSRREYLLEQLPERAFPVGAAGFAAVILPESLRLPEVRSVRGRRIRGGTVQNHSMDFCALCPMPDRGFFHALFMLNVSERI